MNKIYNFLTQSWELATFVFSAIINPMTLVAGLTTLFIVNRDAFFTYLHNVILQATAAIPAYDLNQTFIGQANQIVPLAETMYLLVALASLKLAAMLFRWIKSVIPTQG